MLGAVGAACRVISKNKVMLVIDDANGGSHANNIVGIIGDAMSGFTGGATLVVAIVGVATAATPEGRQMLKNSWKGIRRYVFPVSMSPEGKQQHLYS